MRGAEQSPLRCAELVELPGVNVEERLRTILNEVGGLTVDANTLGPTDNLFAKGLTSFSTVTVMLALEEEFDVSFPDTLLTRETFTSIDSLSKAIRGLQG